MFPFILFIYLFLPFLLWLQANQEDPLLEKQQWEIIWLVDSEAA